MTEQMHPAVVELDGELIKVMDTVGLTHWYRVTPDGSLEEGAPVTTYHEGYTIHLFVPRVQGIPLLIPTIRRIEHYGSH
jgi:hypothetical protein